MSFRKSQIGFEVKTQFLLLRIEIGSQNYWVLGTGLRNGAKDILVILNPHESESLSQVKNQYTSDLYLLEMIY